jgi:glycosyltransferase involved in cell wall biosynthesis
MRTTVIIPALNEEEAIGRVLGDIPAALVEEVVVVDNGSMDGTAERARAAGATVLHEPLRGYGRACLRGIGHAQERGAELIVFLDGDYSDHPEEMAELVAPILRDEADFVVGSRLRGRAERGALLPQARAGNWLACRLIHAFWGARYTDLGPFRAIRLRTLLDLDVRDPRYGWTVEMQISAAASAVRIAEVPVSYRRRIGRSKVTGTFSGTMKASARILWVIAREAVKKLRRPASQ